MAIGIFNPADTARTTSTRPTQLMLGEAIRKWMSDPLKTRPKSQDWNAIIANFRAAADMFAVTDDETNADNILRDSMLAAIADLTTGAVVTLASAATVNLGTTRNSRIDISGNVAISSFGSTPNKVRLVRLSGAPLITLPNGQSFQAAANDAFWAASDNSGAWRIYGYFLAAQTTFGRSLLAAANAAAAKTALGLNLVNNTAVSSGTYTPTLTAVANLDSVTAGDAQWMRVGDVVTVSGTIGANPTASVDPDGTTTSLGISLPVASDFVGAGECAGAGSAPGVAGMSVAILADTVNNRAQMQWMAKDISNRSIYYTFTYRVL